MTTTRSLSQAYYEWLCDQVRPEGNNPTYEGLFDALYHKEFVWIIPNDDNRIEDGLDLLADFFRMHGLAAETERVNGKGCSFLELVIGLSRRLSFVAGGTAQEWAWHLLGNIGFHSMTDPLTRGKRKFIDEAMDKVIWRTYKANGDGGLFPLAWPQDDQRKIELWYQMSEYVEETQDLE